MARALDLARRPAFTSPNPRVGCVVVRAGEILGEGWHEGAGHPHAEPLALEGVDARGATLYSSLEPCVHHGRTPPCVPTIVAAGVRRVVAATADPDELVSGKGFAALTEAGIEVEVGVLAAEAESLNAAYLHHRRTGTSFVSLKLALSLDGALAAADGSSRWITGPAARARVHLRRQEADAVMVGAGTVAADDPALTVRDIPARRQPVRILVDGSGRTPASRRLFTTTEGGPVVVATTERATDARRDEWASAGAEVLVLPPSSDGVDLDRLLKELGARDVVEVLCEGGATLARSLLQRRIVQRLELHLGSLILGEPAIRLGNLGIRTMSDAARWALESVDEVDGDVLLALRPSDEGA